MFIVFFFCTYSFHIAHNCAAVYWLWLLHNFTQLSLNSGSAKAQTLFTACRDGEDLWQWSPLELRLNAFCRLTIPETQFSIDLTNLEKSYSRISEKHDQTSINFTSVFNITGQFSNFVGFDEIKWLWIFTKYTTQNFITKPQFISMSWY